MTSTKDMVLQELIAAKGDALSGAALSKTFGISRQAVHKIIISLKNQGYIIEAIGRSGYALDDSVDLLSAGGIKALLPAGLSCDIHIYDTLASTNLTAKEMAINKAPHGLTVIAQRQSEGRGRQGKGFFSPQGGLYLSIILKPEEFAFSLSEMATVFAALCVCKAIESTTHKTPRIKPVNDIFLEGLKVCGILSETVIDLESGAPSWVVIGAGINISPPKEGFPEEIKHIAGALYNNDPPIKRNVLAAALITQLLSPPKDPAEITEGYEQRLLKTQ